MDDQNQNPQAQPLPIPQAVVVSGEASVPPQNNPSVDTKTSDIASPTQNPIESVILQDHGYLQNVFVKSATAKKLTLTLYGSHLKVEDSDTGEVMEDVLINQIVKTSPYISSSFLALLYTSLGQRFLY